jgi:hypothetical protein
MRLKTWAWLLPIVVVCLPLHSLQAALPSDEDRLKQAGIRTDPRSLSEFLRQQTTSSPAHLLDLIRQLGSVDFEQREEAERNLLALGKPALAPLEKACFDADPEIARRADRCYDAIAQKAALAPDRSLLAVRVLLQRDPAIAIPALLEYLPRAPSGDVEEAVWFGLVPWTSSGWW